MTPMSDQSIRLTFDVLAKLCQFVLMVLGLMKLIGIHSLYPFRWEEES